MPRVIPVSDPGDPRLDGYRDLRDRERASRTGRFVAESAQVIEQLVSSSHYPVESVLLTPVRLEGATWLKGLPDQTPVYVADAALLERIAGFRVHRGCLALGIRGEAPRVDDVLGDETRTVVMLDGVADPDNVGSVFRSSLALGGDAVLLGDTCADPLYRKAIRTSMGAVFRVPYGRFGSVTDAAAMLRARGFCVVALTPDSAAESVADFAARTDVYTPVAWLLGNEGTGLRSDALRAADVKVWIPMRPAADSINVHVAAAVALSHLGRAVTASTRNR